MTFGRPKRLLLGMLALLAPLPLPFNQVIGWPSLVTFWVAVGLFMRRAWQDSGGWLPNWMMNLLALGYLPVLFFDVTALSRGRILQPVVHLLLFALAVKLFALRRERDKWQTLLVVFFVFLAATGTSVHPAVVLYIVAFLTLALLLLSRFTSFEMLSRHARRAPEMESVPLAGFVTGSVIFAILAAIPLFVFLPRLRSPYVLGPGGGYGSLTQVSSFQDVMRLDGIGRVRGSRAVALRLTYETPPASSHEARIKVMTYDRFENEQWSRRVRRPRRNEKRLISRQPDGFYPLGREPVYSWMEVWMQPFRGVGLAIPVDAVELDVIPTALEKLVSGATGSPVLLDDSGVVELSFGRPTMVRYRVGLAEAPRTAVTSPLLALAPELELDPGGVTPRIAALAAEVMGEGTMLERGRRLETHLAETFEYTTDLIGAPEGESIETFLFENRRGHCELFASSMVLMLRSQGVPARLATGFLGAEYNPIEGYYIVRQSNAHAWVEAHDEARGWRVFDPTPPAGRPMASEAGLAQLVSQLYDFLLFRWDRYILTYGLADQVGFVASLRELWLTITGWFGGDGEAAAELVSRPAPLADPATVPEEELPAQMTPAAWWPLGLGLLLVTGGFFWYQHQRFDATVAYLRLRERLRPELGPRLESVPPLAMVQRYVDRYPHCARPARELVELYLGESFAGRRLSAEQVRRARELLRLALRRDRVLLSRGGSMLRSSSPSEG
ncbi:MAG: transglutaminaseTgpA domain-containing protein [Acidobacteria bacterium]|nr:transglutaminaseTgpA domain-containing protein [Acidobacteriota bacterium]